MLTPNTSNPALTLFFFAIPGLGWREPGHRALARLAAARLSPAATVEGGCPPARKGYSRLCCRRNGGCFTWADNIKAQNHTARWHFINIASRIPERYAEAVPNGNCITDRIDIFERSSLHMGRCLADGRDALRYVIHLIGRHPATTPHGLRRRPWVEIANRSIPLQRSPKSA